MDRLLKIYKYSKFQIVRGNGVFLFDQTNKKYLDFSSGIAVNALGYNHYLINKVILKQLKVGILHLSGSQLHKYKLLLASQLSNLSNKGKVFFSNSGAESIEAALKFARIFGDNTKKKYEIISMKRGFHGRTLGALSLGSNKYYKTGFGQVPGQVKFCRFNDSEHLKKLVDRKKTLAIIIECIQGDGGIYVCSKEFAKTIKNICKKYKVLLIVDEIQTGIGRTGKFFSYKHFSFKPDIITVAKALGSGYPIAATIVRKSLSKYIKIGIHGSTFGGGMMQTRIANEIISFVNKKRFLSSIKNKGIYLKHQLNKLKKDFPQIIHDVRGMGLMMAIEVNKNYNKNYLILKTLKYGLIITIINDNTFRITPPLTISKKEIDLGVNKLRKVFKDL